MIQFSDVCKTYPNGTKALKNVTLHIEKGEFVFVVGASGAGKSTLIKTLLCEEQPTSGTVCVNGYDLKSITRKQLPRYRRSLGIVFQDFRLIPNMTVYDNVAFVLRVTNAQHKDIRFRVRNVLNLLGLDKKKDCMPSQLSGGEQQRVALARALVNNPSVIIADEPTGNVDPELSLEIVDLLSTINEQAGTTVVMVTHAHELVQYFNKRVITIDKGVVVSDTDSAEQADLFVGEERLRQHEEFLHSQGADEFDSLGIPEKLEEPEKEEEQMENDGYFVSSAQTTGNADVK